PLAVRPDRVGSSPARGSVRLRLRVGALRSSGEAPVGLVRAADRLPRPARREVRAADRPRERAGAGSGPLVGGGLCAGPREGPRRRDARGTACVPPVRRCDEGRMGGAVEVGEAPLRSSAVNRWEWRTFGAADDVFGDRPPERVQESDELYVLSVA